MPFSFWPVGANGRQAQSLIFASDPWGMMSGVVKARCPKLARPAALAFLKQAEDNFRAADDASIIGAKPVLLYYSFLNLSKAYILTIGQQPSLDRAKHGLSERLLPGGKELVDASIELFPSLLNNISVFDEFYRSVSGAGLVAATQLKMVPLLAQIVTGHRLWCAASGARERFLAITRVDLLEDRAAKSVWATFAVRSKDVQRVTSRPRDLLAYVRLAPAWNEVRGGANGGRTFEQTAARTYNKSPAEVVDQAVTDMRLALWTTVLSTPPYRTYYLYSLDAPDTVLPQLLSMYGVMFYLGSVTRYRPHLFAGILDGPYGPVIQEVISAVPSQFLFLMASRFAAREVTQPAIV